MRDKDGSFQILIIMKSLSALGGLRRQLWRPDMFFIAPSLLGKIFALCRHQYLCFALDVYILNCNNKTSI